jgi:hypothetical protein
MSARKRLLIVGRGRGGREHEEDLDLQVDDVAHHLCALRGIAYSFRETCIR